MITYPTPNELAASMMIYAATEKRYVAELRAVIPIVIALALKQRPENAESRIASLSLPGFWREPGGTGSQGNPSKH